MLLGMVSSLFIVLANDIEQFIASLFGLLFFGGALVPSLTGIMLNSVPAKYKTSAQSLA